MKHLRLDKAEPDGSKRPGDDEGDACDPAELPQASVRCDPVDLLEPPGRDDDLEELAQMSDMELKQVGDAFTQALAWALQGSTIVEMGQRLTVMLHVMRPCLIVGVATEIDLERDLRARLDDVDPRLIGRLFGRVLEWARRASRLSEWGERLMAMTSVMRPTLIGARTNAAIGGVLNKSRQAINRKVQDFRDTFGGIKAAAMRGERTRHQCRISQLSK